MEKKLARDLSSFCPNPKFPIYIVNVMLLPSKLPIFSTLLPSEIKTTFIYYLYDQFLRYLFRKNQNSSRKNRSHSKQLYKNPLLPKFKSQNSSKSKLTLRDHFSLINQVEGYDILRKQSLRDA